ncbi:MAG: cytochrome P450 [SAR324 cluster bacterium]|nr:cytochrome P450 [SAR324 cluster bacterium]
MTAPEQICVTWRGEITGMELQLDIRNPANLRDPFPLFRRLRAEAPVYWSGSLRGWMVTRYDDVLHILQNPLRYSSERFRKLGPEYSSARPAVRDVARVLGDWMVLRDPPQHTRLRGFLHNSFTPRTLEAMRPTMQRVVDDLFDRIEAQGSMEFIEDFAFPLPASVIAAMMGVPPEDIPQMRVWSDQLAAYLGGSQDEQDNMEQARQGVMEMSTYFHGLLKVHEGNPQDDLITLMLQAKPDGDRLSPEEIVSNCVLLLFAGHETTTNLLGNGLFHLLRNPTQYRLLRGRPDLAVSAVEEFLRYDASVPAVLKVAAEDIELGGQEIGQGQVVLPFLASANRDPERFDRADELDVARQDNRHLAFAFGIHFCLGAPLARMEARIAFATLFQRFSNLTLLDEDPPWLPQIFLRGLEALPVGFHAQGRAKAAVG